MDAASLTGRLTESYSRWRSTRLGRITDAIEQRLLFDLLDPCAGMKLLDVGCGDGALALEFAQHGMVVTGLDADKAMIAAARWRIAVAEARLRLTGGDAERLPFTDAAFDRVVAVTVLCFVRDAGQVVAEMARMLKPGGRMVIGELGRWSWWAAHRRVRGWLGDPVWRAAKLRTVKDLSDLVHAAGLDVLESRGAVHYPPCGIAAVLLAPVDPWLGRSTTFGSAFIAVSARKPIAQTHSRSR